MHLRQVRTRRLARGLLPALAGALLVAGTAAATTVERLDLATLAGRADRIVLATCQGTVAVELDGDLYTRVHFAVIQTLKGQARPHLEALFAGGELGERRQWLSGMPAFEPGEEVVLFLTAPDAEGRVWPIGLAQGKFRVEPGPDGEPQVVNGAAEALLVPSGSAARPAGPGGAAPLEVFLARVRHLLTQPVQAPDAR
ncbi:MAG: hypothetical protein ABIL09_26660 [Gemmatimonadota bacterium]